MPKPSELDIVLIRAGATEWDDAGRLVGAADLPLSASGRADLTTTLAPIDEESFCSVLCGPDEASRATAELVAHRADAKVRVVDNLGEVDLGLWEGLLATDVEDRYPKAYKQWLENPAGVLIPEGEPLPECRERLVLALCKALDKCKAGEGRPVAVVLRPFAMALVGEWLGESDDRLVVSEIKNAGPIARYRVSRAGLKSGRDRLKAAV